MKTDKNLFFVATYVLIKINFFINNRILIINFYIKYFTFISKWNPLSYSPDMKVIIKLFIA